MPLEVITNKPVKKENIFVQTVKIDEMSIEYDTKMVENSKYIDDVGIRCKLDIGRDFKPNFYVGGSFKKNPIGNTVEGWGTAYKTKLFFERLGVPLKLQKGKSLEENKLPEGLEDSFIGETFHRLTYISTRKNKHGDQYKTDWQQIGDSQESKDILKNEFLNAVNQGYVKDFLSPDTSPTSGEPISATKDEIKNMVSGNLGI